MQMGGSLNVYLNKMSENWLWWQDQIEACATDTTKMTARKKVNAYRRKSFTKPLLPLGKN